MRDYDRLPPELRAWLAQAVLPWRPRSASRAFAKAYAETGDKRRAIDALNDLQNRLIARDAAQIWGDAHPASEGGRR